MATSTIRKRSTKKGEAYQIIIETERDKSEENPNKGRNRIFKTVYCTKKEAEKIMREMLNKIDNQAFIKDNKTTVKEFLEEWLELFIEPHLAPTTVFGYKNQLSKYVYPILGNKRLQELKTTHIQKFYNDMKIKSPLSDKPLGAKTIRNIHMNLLAAFDKAVEQEVIPKNPAKLAQLPKGAKYKAEVYSLDEINQLFELVKDTDLELAIHILILLGLRRGELVGLRWSNVDLQNNTVNIIENAVMIKNDVIIKDPKSESGKRTIEMPESLTLMMKKAKLEYLQRRSKQKVRNINEKDDYVITQPDGTPYKPSSFSQKIRRFLLDTPLKRIRLHDMRHTNATLMLQLGISAKVAQKRLGHADFSTTMDLYTHVLQDVEKEAAAKMEVGVYSNPKSKSKHG